MAYCTGWPIPHIRDEVDLPTLAALREQWAQYPPLPVVVAHYLGFAKPRRSADQIERLEDQDVMPATRLSAEAFDKMLTSMGLPTTVPTKP